MNAHRLCSRCGESFERGVDLDTFCPDCGLAPAPNGAAQPDEDEALFDDILPPLDQVPALTVAELATRDRSNGDEPPDTPQESSDELPLLVESDTDTERDVPSPFGKARHKKERAPTHRPLPPAVRKPVATPPLEDQPPTSSEPSASRRMDRSLQGTVVNHAIKRRTKANPNPASRPRSDDQRANEFDDERRSGTAGPQAGSRRAEKQDLKEGFEKNTASEELATPVAPAPPTSLVVAVVIGVAVTLGALLWNQFQPTRAKPGPARSVKAVRATPRSNTKDSQSATSSTASPSVDPDTSRLAPSQASNYSSSSSIPPNNPFVDEPDERSTAHASDSDSSLDPVVGRDELDETNEVDRDVDIENAVASESVNAPADQPDQAITSTDNTATAASNDDGGTAPSLLDESLAGVLSESEIASGDSNRSGEPNAPLQANPAAGNESRGQLTGHPATRAPNEEPSAELDFDSVAMLPEQSVSEPTDSELRISEQADSDLVRVAASVSTPTASEQAAHADDSVSRDRNITAAATRPSVDRAIMIPTQLPAELVPVASPSHSTIETPRYTGEQLQRSLRVARDSLVRLNANPNAPRADRMRHARELYRCLCEVGQCVAYIDTNDRRLGQRMEATDALLMRIASSEALTNLIGRTATSWLRFNDRPNNGIALAGRVSSIRAVGDYFETELQLLSRPDTSLRVVSHVTPQLDPRVPFDVGAELVVLGALIERAEELPGYSGELPVIYRGHHVTISPQ